MNTDLHFSSKTDLHETPKGFFEKLKAEFGFDVDVCATPENAKCKKFFTRETDGLTQEWRGVCWMNPPYGREIKQWVKKAYESSLNGATVVCLLPSRTDTAWWHDFVMKASETRFLRGRLKFGNAKNSAPFPSAIVILDHPKSEKKLMFIRVLCYTVRVKKVLAHLINPNQTIEHRRFKSMAVNYSKLINLVGQQFGKLKVIEYAYSLNKARWWRCLCECGNTKETTTERLRSGNLKSCGCQEGFRSHGLSKVPEYQIWRAMRMRCHNETDRAYRNYGARGITVCDRWRNSFENFISDMGFRPSSNLSLERIDNDKGYSPENCKWATMKDQSRNQRRNRLITFGGETLCLEAWAEKLKITPNSLSKRLKKWSIEKALTAPKTLARVALLTLIFFAGSAVAQERFRSHDHPPPHHQKRGEPRRVVRTTPRITITGTDPRLYNRINDCSNYWARDDAPEWVKRQAARDKRTCLREVRRSQRHARK